jgi:hypothetical protein
MSEYPQIQANVDNFAPNHMTFILVLYYLINFKIKNLWLSVMNYVFQIKLLDIIKVVHELFPVSKHSSNHEFDQRTII